MDVLANLALGFQTAMSLSNLLYCLIGVFLGTAVGVLPGIGPIATIAMLLPITFGLPPVSALIMLSGIYYGAQYGGSTTAILINLPGESASVVTALDGYRMARQGHAGLALATAAIGSFIAGTAATVLVALFAPPLAEVALKFGPAEYFSLMVLGLVASIVLASGSLLHALGMVVVGLTLGLVGTDVNSGIARFSFGFPQLADGIGFVVIAMGMFGLAEIVANLEHEATRTSAITNVKGLLPSREDWKRILGPIWRGTVLGSALGILPGGGAILASFASYSLEKKLSNTPEKFGQGAVEGVAGPEAANNAGAQTSFIPMLTLGIPANPVMALMIGALMIQGIQPGPTIITEQATLFWGVVVSMWVGNVFLLILNLPLIGLWVRMITVSPALSGDHRVLRDRRLFDQQHHLRRLPDGPVRPARIRVPQVRLRGDAAPARLHSRSADGGASAPRAGAVGRPAGCPAPRAGQRLPAGGCRGLARLGVAAGNPEETRGDIRFGKLTYSSLSMIFFRKPLRTRTSPIGAKMSSCPGRSAAP
jgi:putative tricarboxylic transport membrane protein